MSRPKSISKELTTNDLGANGTHQAGICVPKGGGVLEWFPTLGLEEKNPRVDMYFTDESGKVWKFCYIYYNTKPRHEGTRNEYRLTGMTAYFREMGLQVGDTITLTHEDDGSDSIHYQRRTGLNVSEVILEDGKKMKRLVISKNWQIIDC